MSDLASVRKGMEARERKRFLQAIPLAAQADEETFAAGFRIWLLAKEDAKPLARIQRERNGPFGSPCMWTNVAATPRTYHRTALAASRQAVLEGYRVRDVTE